MNDASDTFSVVGDQDTIKTTGDTNSKYGGNVFGQEDAMNSVGGGGEAEFIISDSDEESKGRCSKCVTLSGHLQARNKVDAPINWLVDACVETGLIPESLRMTYKDEPAQVIAHWDRDVKHSTGERYRTGGGITDAQFWPEVLSKIPRPNVCRPPTAAQMVFTDFGSEFFLQGLLCAMLGDFKEVVGIEIDEDKFEKSVQLANYLMDRATREDKFMSKIELHQGDFLTHEAGIAISERSTVVYANNVVFGSDCNDVLVKMWRKHLPAGAIMVVFDDTAILGSGGQRISRLSRTFNWTSKISTMNASVSWQPTKKLDVQMWQVSPEYTNMRRWAASAKFADLLGWASFYGKACIIVGAKRSSLLPEQFTVFSDFSTLNREWTSALQRDAQGIFLAVTSTNNDYIHARKQLSMKLQDPSTRANLNFFCVVDCSDHHPILSILLQEILKMKR